VSAKKKVIIITDATESIQLVARSVKEVLTNCTVKICPADKFEGTALLPVDVFILGCEKPKPPSFSYIEEMLSHINLVSRKCGIFSVNEKSLKYLKGIVKDCEAGLLEPFLVKDGKIRASEVKKWLKEVIK
jgi:hypothetical protein